MEYYQSIKTEQHEAINGIIQCHLAELGMWEHIHVSVNYQPLFISYM